MIQIAPSMLSADFLHLEKDIEMVNTHADIFHLDVMDGVFVPNISYGFPIVEAVASRATKPLDTHLMIVNPENMCVALLKPALTWCLFTLMPPPTRPQF